MTTRSGHTRGLLILGIGNVLMGDEGVGVRVADALALDLWPDGVTVVDGGTGGFHLLEYLQEFNPVLMVDATLDGRPPGTVRVLKPRYAADFPRTLTAHDVGLRDLVETTAVLGPLPDITLITVSIAEIRSMVTDLSAAVAAAVPEVVSLARQIVAAEREAAGADREASLYA